MSAMPESSTPIQVADDQLIDAEVDSVPQPRVAMPASAISRVLLGASLVLIAFNLRPVFSSASALLPEIARTFGLSATSIGLLTTLPVVCLGAFSPMAPWLARKIGTERTLLGVLALLMLGTALRSFNSIALLFFGTALAGACIAVGNVLLPGLVKRDFPDKAALMTGCYTMALCAGAAAAAGFTVPIEHFLNGSAPAALGAWALPVFIVLLLWLPQTLSLSRRPKHAGFRVQGLLRDPLAWQVTLFMGFQSALAYSVFGWLVPILRERGIDGVTAGAIVSVSVMVQAGACLIVPHVAVRRPDQRAVVVALLASAVAALLGMLFAPLSTVWMWAVLQGIGQGGLIAVAMTIIVLRSPDAHVAAHLSGMAQCVGYLLAAIGPLIVGLLHSWTGNFAASAFLFILLGLCAGIAGWGAGRSAHVKARATALEA